MGRSACGSGPHVADAYEEGENLNREATLAQIRAAFDAEWEAPTDGASGDLT